jgi:hypothetical protein
VARNRHRQVGWLSLLALVIGGCAFPRYYGDAEYRLGTGDFYDSQGHFAVYYPTGIQLSFPGYIVGTEVSAKTAVLRENDLVMDRMEHAGSSLALLVDDVVEGQRIPYISQVIRYSGKPMGVGNCALYSLYQTKLPPLMRFCDGKPRPEIGDWSKYRSAYADSWGAIDVLKESIRRDMASGNYTHLIVAMMGWRTPQEEAIRNFNSIMRSLRLAAKGEFRPLFIGITWVGPWAGRWLDPLMEATSYPRIANLADTLGLTWLGVLTDEIVVPLGDRLDTVFITHSFGARAASTAICIGPAIRRTAKVARAPLTGKVGQLIGFEPAFSLQRFKKKRLIFFYEDIYFPDDCARARSIVLTTSKYDFATRSILWADLAGNYQYYGGFCRSNGSLATCRSVDANGEIEGGYDTAKRLLYLDASELIRFKAPGTDGDAHSDVFRPAVGRLIWNIISPQAAAPHGQAPANEAKRGTGTDPQ